MQPRAKPRINTHIAVIEIAQSCPVATGCSFMLCSIRIAPLARCLARFAWSVKGHSDSNENLREGNTAKLWSVKITDSQASSSGPGRQSAGRSIVGVHARGIGCVVGVNRRNSSAATTVAAHSREILRSADLSSVSFPSSRWCRHTSASATSASGKDRRAEVRRRPRSAGRHLEAPLFLRIVPTIGAALRLCA